MKAWPKARLGEVLTLVDTSVPTEELQEVNLAGVYSFGRGLFKRGPISPAKTTYKRYNQLRTNDFVISQPKAWEGALARVTSEFEGWYLSPVFPTFRADRSRLEPAFLDWFCRRPAVWSELQRGSRGIGARRESVSPKQFLSLEIPLPPLAEQECVVARIEAVRKSVDEVRTIRSEEEVQARQILTAAFWRIARTAPRLPMRDVAPLIRRAVQVVSEQSYPELGVRSFGRGTFHKAALTGLELGTKRVFRIEPGDLLFNIVFAWEGAVAVAKSNDTGRFGSHRFLTCVPKSNVATAQFLRFYFLTDEGLDVLGTVSPGGAGRNRTLSLTALEAIAVPVPSMGRQRWFDSLQAEVASLRRLQTETDAELDALLSSVLDCAFRGEL